MQSKKNIATLKNLIHQVVLITILSVLFSFSVKPQSNNQFKDSIDALLSNWNKQAPGISIAVVKDGQTVYKKYLGMANIKKERVNDSITTFWVASVTKQFTAAAIYLLSSERKLNLDSSVLFYMPNLPAIFQNITINHLVHHISGIRDGFVLTALSKKPPTEYNNENVLGQLASLNDLNSPAGTKFEYNNSGYVLLAKIIEQVTGKPFPTYIKENIFLPLGMKDTYVSASFPASNVQAEGYQEAGNNNFQEYHFPGNTYGSTGVIATLADMSKWASFLQYPATVPVLSAVAEPMLQTGKLKSGRPIAYAGGLEKFSYRQRFVYEHFGADEGFKANMLYFPATHISIIGLTNNGSYYGLSSLLYKISNLMHKDQWVQAESINENDSLKYETYYYNARIPQFLKVQNFGNYARVSNLPEGYATPYLIMGDTLKNMDAVPVKYLVKKNAIEILDSYYQNNNRLLLAKPIVNNGHLKTFSGEYFSAPLQTSYKIIADDSSIQLEFIPGLSFKLFRITNTDFLFEYSGPNYIQFTKQGFYFSREGCRKLFFKKQ